MIVRFNMNMDYRLKLLLSISVISIIMLSILTFNRVSLLKDVLYKKTLSRVETIGNLLCNEILEDYLENNTNSIQKTANLASQQAFVNSVSVIDIKNKVIISSDKTLTNKTNLLDDSNGIEKIKGNVYIKSFTLKNKKMIYGRVQVNFSLIEMKNDFQRMMYWSLGLSGLALLMILWVAWIVSGNLLSPLLEMKEISNKIAKGDFSPRIKVESQDIIGELGIALNVMAEHLDDLTKNLNTKIINATDSLQEKTIQLEETNRKLMELDKLKTEFVTIVSHELKTPLTGILGFTDTLLKLQLPKEKVDKYIRIIDSEGKRLYSLIEEFLDISKIELGKLNLHITETTAQEIVKEIVDAFEIIGNIKIEQKFPQTDLKLKVDKDRIKQVVFNIMNNAMKYSHPEGKILIKGEDIGESMMISVQDDGPGVKKDELNKIFDSFYRSKDDVNAENQGSGLGLSIAKGIIEMHKGKIWVESEFGKGSKFIFILPKT